jgi:predicted CopG family antitoxin
MPKQVTGQKEGMKTLKISEKTHRRLSKHGQFRESFEDIINRALDVLEEQQQEKSSSKK